MNSKPINFMDSVEIDLISKFFNLNCNEILLPRIGLIEKLPSDSSRMLRTIGQSGFHNIVEFYKFEYKENEASFWDNFTAKEKLADIKIDLTVSKLPFEYLWLDYVTDVKFKYDVINGNLAFEYYNLSQNVYIQSLELIVKMIFLSDFLREKKCTSIDREWDLLFVELNSLNKRIESGLYG